MHIRLVTLLGFIAAPLTAALAHQDGLHHSHPHLVITNEWLAILLGIGALVLVYGARRILKGQHLKRGEHDSTRGRK